METRYCVVCYKDISGVEFGIDQDENEYGQETCSSLKNQLPVIFMVEKFLEIPKGVCSQFLQDYGNPSSWIHWCSTCALLVKKAKTCFLEIVALEQKFKTLQMELQNIICLSQQTRLLSIPTVNTEMESKFSNGLTDIVRSYILEGKMDLPSHAKVQIKEEATEFNSDESDDAADFMDISSYINMEQICQEKSFPSSKENPLEAEKFCREKVSKLSSKSKTVIHEKHKSQTLRANITKDCLAEEGGNCRKLHSSRQQKDSHNSENVSVLGEEEKAFKCHECPKEFKTKHYLRKHLKFHLGRPHKCEVCGKTFVRLQDIKEHSLTHSEDRPFSCVSCGKTFRQACSLGRHQREMCGVLHECTVCNEKFEQISKLKNHSTTAHGIIIKQVSKREKNRKRKSRSHCTICGKTLSRLQDLKRHLLTHTGERPHSCSICAKTFKQSGEVTVHMRIHTGEKPFICSECGKAYKTNTELKVHSKVHSGLPVEKPFLCSICGKTFSTQNRLNLHWTNHTGEKHFSCETCQHKTSNHQSLQRHMLIHTRPFLCNECGKGFPTHSQLKVHIRVHTGEKPYLCVVCGKAFADKNNLNKHVKIHEKH